MNDTSDNENQKIDSTETDYQAEDDETRIDLRVQYPDITDLKIYQVIGKGGSGIVYKGRQLFLERDVAIKLLLINPEDEEFYKRFQREAQILAKLSHHNIVSCYQAGMTNASNNTPSAPFIAMEFINGPTLHEWIHKKGKLTSLLSLNITIYIAKALNYALQQGIIHRDIKAENILLKPLHEQQGENNEPEAFQFIPKLADLGIARTFTADRSDDLTQVGYMVGTPSSMAPEQFDDPDNIDFKADIYGLGCVLYHMLTGSKLYIGKSLTDLIISKNSDTAVNPIQQIPELDNDLVELVTSMLAKDKDNRPSYEKVIQQCQLISDRLNNISPHKTNSRSYLPKIALFSTIAVIFAIVIGLFFYSDALQDMQNSQNDIVVTEDQSLPASEETLIREEQPIHEELPISEEIPLEKDQAQKIDTIPVPEAEQFEIENEQASQHDKQLNVDKMSLTISYANSQQGLLQPGEAFNISVTPGKDAYIYCYYKDQSNSIIRFFPNRFNDNALVSAKYALILPGDMPFDLNANQEGISEFISCFAFDQDITGKVPADILGTDFEPLTFVSMQAIRNAFLNDGYEFLNEQTLEIKVGVKPILDFGQ